MSEVIDIRIRPEAWSDLEGEVRRALGRRPAGWRLERRSVDARRGQAPMLNLRVSAWDGEPPPPQLQEPERGRPRSDRRVVIVGAGPAGLFAALALVGEGVPVQLVDRGGGFPQRHHRVRDLRLRGELDPDSNIRFGLGGAGTYSDGKLFTRKRGPEMRRVLSALAWFGREVDPLVEARPHLGSNRLIPLLERFQVWLADAGVQFRFQSTVDALLERAGRVAGARLSTGEELPADAVILAPGNAARSTFEMLHAKGVAMESSPFAVGVRVEHPRELIDGIQFRDYAGHPALGAAEYRLALQAGGRGVYTFCMCPGGHVLSAPAEPERLAVNGASFRSRSSPRSNAALVVTVDGRDWGTGDALGGMRFQRELERLAFEAGGGGYRAPVQGMLSFLSGRKDAPPPTSYKPGTTEADLVRILPEAVVDGLRQGLRRAGGLMRGYLTSDAALIGVETTTASPVRILRGEDGASPSSPGLYPCGEGAGWAGGITSSAADGWRTGMRVANSLP